MKKYIIDYEIGVKTKNGDIRSYSEEKTIQFESYLDMNYTLKLLIDRMKIKRISVKNIKYFHFTINEN